MLHAIGERFIRSINLFPPRGSPSSLSASAFSTPCWVSVVVAPRVTFIHCQICPPPHKQETTELNRPRRNQSCGVVRSVLSGNTTYLYSRGIWRGFAINRYAHRFPMYRGSRYIGKTLVYFSAIHAVCVRAIRFSFLASRPKLKTWCAVWYLYYYTI